MATTPEPSLLVQILLGGLTKMNRILHLGCRPVMVSASCKRPQLVVVAAVAKNLQICKSTDGMD